MLFLIDKNLRSNYNIVPVNNTGNSDISILVIYHSQSGHTAKMAQAVAEGAASLGNVNVLLKKAADATLQDLLNCSALAIGSPENFGYMSGMIKDFFDRMYYQKAHRRKESFRKPYVVFISASNDGTGANSHIEKICTAFTFKKVNEPVIARGEVSTEYLKKCFELGQLIATGCDMGIF